MGKKIKILYVCPVGERGGVETVQLNIIRGLETTRYIPIVVVLEDGPFIEDLKKTGATVYVVESGRVRNFIKGMKAVKRIQEIIQTEDIKIVHSHNAKAHIYGGLAAKFCRIPCIFHLHGIPKLSFSRDGFVSYFACKIKTNKVIAVSKYVLEGSKRIWENGYDTEIVYNGILLSEQKIDKVKTREELLLPTDLFIVSYVGRLQSGKGVDIFIKSAKEVVRNINKVMFLVIGDVLFKADDRYKNELIMLTKEYALDERVKFFGFQHDIAKLYYASDLIVVPSVQPDSFPTVILESMACGLPVVASRIGGIPEMIEDGKTGYLFSPGNLNELSELIIKLLKSPELMKQMGDAGRKKVQETFTITNMIDNITNIYKKLIE